MADSKGLEEVPEGRFSTPSSLLVIVLLERASQGFFVLSRQNFPDSTNTFILIGQIESNYDETTDSFDAMNLKPELLRGVYAYGFERPSAIQQRAIMPIIKGECSSRIHMHLQYFAN